MSAAVLPLVYLKWHYSRALRDFLGIWSNVLWFVGNLFSVATLLRTLITPIKLMEEEKGSFVLDPQTFAENLLVNIIMRIVGAVTRLVLIVVALVMWLFLLVFGLAFFILWFFVPFLLVGVFGTGVTLLV
jgi:hypothetical protein